MAGLVPAIHVLLRCEQGVDARHKAGHDAESSVFKAKVMPAAFDQSYDGIIVGAGHHGLVLGSYLQKCGLNILLVDRRLQYGGALVTEEATAPGFYHNLHSINHFHISETPWFKDLNLGDRVEYITPRYEFGQPHLDGSALIFGRDLEETLANVARFSKKDAQTFRDWNRKAEEITAKISCRSGSPIRCRRPSARRCCQERHRPRLPGDDEAAAVRRGQGAVRERARAASVPLQDFAVRHLAGRHAVEDQPDGLGDPRLRPAKRLPALQGRLGQPRPRAVRDHIASGGRYAPQVELDKIVIEGGKATGITLKNGRTVRAKQFVASTLNVGQTFDDAIGREQLPAAFLKKLDNFQHTKWTIFGLHLALHEPVRFNAEKFDPNIRRTLKWSLGAETMEELLAAHQDVMANRVPEIVQFGSGPLSVIDPTQAPPGKHTTYAWHVMPFAPDHKAKDYETFKAEFAERIIEKWAKYAPNMTRKNIIAQYVYTAQEYSQTFPEMRGGDIFMGSFGADQVMYNHFGYRTPIDRLYMAGSACHPAARSPAARATSAPASSPAISD